MTMQPLSFLPGVCKVNSTYADSLQMAYVNGRSAMGRFTDMDGARFAMGFPEKLAGYTAAISTPLAGVPRGTKDWRDNSGVIRLGIGTNEKLYYYAQGADTDITPWRAIKTGTLSNPFNTTNGSAVVTVNHTAHGLQSNDYVMLTASSTVGGLTIAGTYFVTVTSANAYTINAGINATSTVTGGGGSTAYTYYRIVLSNPFATVNHSTTVTVTHNAHGASVGDFVTFSNASSVAGLTLNGEFQITSVTLNSYTITAPSTANATTTGGGTVWAQYDISVGPQDSAGVYGYGVGSYGLGGYGTPAAVAATVPARTWCLDNYGQQLLANPIGGTIYVWDPVIEGRAYPLYGAPAQVLGMFVTPERFVVALGVNGLAMQLAWPDQSNYNDWTSTPQNSANSGRTLQEGSFLVNGLPIRDGVSLIFSNTACYNFDYTGDNEIYATTIAGKKCGLAGALAGCAVAGVAYWMSLSDFWSWNGGVQALPTDDVRDYIFKNLNLTQSAKFMCGSNIAKKEVWYFYCSSSSNEIDSYAIFHIDQNCFSTGHVFKFTSWIDRGLFPTPMATDANGYLYNLESGVDANGSAIDSYVEFSPIDIASGDRIMDIFGFVPDFQRQTGNITLTVIGRDHPQSPENDFGPYTIADDGSTALIDVRGYGKLMGYKLESNVLGGDWRLGLPHAQIQPAGARR